MIHTFFFLDCLISIEYTLSTFLRKNAWVILFCGCCWDLEHLRLCFLVCTLTLISRLLGRKQFPLEFWSHLFHCLLGSTIRRTEANCDIWFFNVAYFLFFWKPLGTSFVLSVVKFHCVVPWYRSVYVCRARRSVSPFGLKADVFQFWGILKSVWLTFFSLLPTPCPFSLWILNLLY